MKSRKLSFFIFLFLSSLSLLVKAQNTSAEVGTLPGGGDVSGTGAATYSIPIELPSGVAGMQPNLTIGYNSQGGVGLLGIGWNLSCAQSISRAGNNFYYNNPNLIDKVRGIEFDGEDGLSYNGQRLISVGANEWRTEIDQYVKVTAVNGNPLTNPNAYFKVETKSGTVHEFGVADAKLIPGGQTNVLTWFIKKTYDPYGNYILYNYSYNSNSANELILNSIQYGGNSTAGTPSSITVSFQYETKAMGNSYVKGARFDQTQLLNRVNIAVSGTVYYGYKFEFDQTSPLFPRLKKVYKVGQSDATFMSETTVVWGDTPVQSFSVVSSPFIESSSKVIFADVTGDGVPEKIYNTIPDSMTGSGTYQQVPLSSLQGITADTSYLKISSLNFNQQTSVSNTAFAKWTNPIQFTHRIAAGYDFNGDGRKDMMFTTWYEGSAGTDIYQFVNEGDGSRFQKKAGLAVLEGGFSYDFSGDFDGDGKDDLLVLRGETLSGTPQNEAFISYKGGYNSSLYSAQLASGWTNSLAIEESDYVTVMDFNGDGRSEVFSMGDNGYRIVQFTGVALDGVSLMASGSNLTHNDQIEMGDFNADGKTDLLVKKSGTTTWKVYYSTGTVFTPTISEIPTCSDCAINVSDYDGDGKSDILVVSKQATGATTFNCNYDLHIINHGGIINTQSGLIPFSGLISPNLFRSGSTGLYFQDFNGDGICDFGVKGTDNELHAMLFNKYQDMHRIKHITNGLGSSVAFEYMTMIGDNVRHDLGTSAISTYPNAVVVTPMRVVSKMKLPYGNNNGYYDIEYAYQDLISNKEGRGMLGFKYFRAFNLNTRISTLQEYSFNDNFNYPYKYGLLQPAQTTVKYEPTSGSSQLLSTTTYEYLNQAAVNSSPGNRHIYCYPKTITRIDHLTGNVVRTKKNANPAFIQYGDPESETVEYGFFPSGSNTLQVVESSQKFMTYDLYGSFWGGRLKSVTSSTTRGMGATGPLMSTTYKTFTYNTKGYLEQIVQEPGTSKTVTQTTLYHTSFGVPISESLSATGQTTRTSTYDYSPDGRFVTKMINPEGHISEFISHSVWSQTAWAKDINGQISTTTFDNFGRVKTSVSPTGVTATFSYNWSNFELDAPSTPQSTIYCIKKTISGVSGTDATFYDGLNRVTRNATSGFSGARVYNDTRYNDKGGISQTSLPYFGSAAPLWTTYSYDYLGRPISITSPTGVVTTTAYNGNTVTETNTTTGEFKTAVQDAAGKTITVTDNGGTISYTYHPNGGILSTTAAGTVTSMQYDQFGYKIGMTDPHHGTFTYNYNAFGELTYQKDGKGNIYQNMQYDKLGRLKAKTGPEGTYTYTYDTAPFSKSRLVSETSPTGVTRTYEYDNFARNKKVTETIAGVNYTTSVTYNNYGQKTGEVYPNGTTIAREYNPYGFEWKIKSGTTVLWEALGYNALGELLQSKNDLNLKTINTYSSLGFLETSKLQTATNALRANWEYQFNPADGNLTSRKDVTRNLTETFTYDSQDRLKQAKKNGVVTLSMTYDSNGSLASKSDAAGTYSYGSARPHAVATVSNLIGSIPTLQQDIAYNTFNKVSTLTENGKAMTFTYGTSEERVKTVYTVNGTVSATKIYASNFERETKGSVSTDICYIQAAGSGVVLLHEKTSNGTVNRFLNVYKDHLGSILLVTDLTGTVIEEKSYDAWGRYRNPASWTFSWGTQGTLIQNPIYYRYARGYTGHEHHTEFGIINMNGRIYDPILGQMCSPDPHITNPSSSQSYNRHSYVMNNPLKYTDPTGYDLEVSYEQWSWEKMRWLNITVTAGYSYSAPSTQLLGDQSSVLGVISAWNRPVPGLAGYGGNFFGDGNYPQGPMPLDGTTKINGTGKTSKTSDASDNDDDNWTVLYYQEVMKFDLYAEEDEIERVYSGCGLYVDNVVGKDYAPVASVEITMNVTVTKVGNKVKVTTDWDDDVSVGDVEPEKDKSKYEFGGKGIKYKDKDGHVARIDLNWFVAVPAANLHLGTFSIGGSYKAMDFGKEFDLSIALWERTADTRREFFDVKTENGAKYDASKSRYSSIPIAPWPGSNITPSSTYYPSTEKVNFKVVYSNFATGHNYSN